jgi:hypothetical protein
VNIATFAGNPDMKIVYYVIAVTVPYIWVLKAIVMNAFPVQNLLKWYKTSNHYQKKCNIKPFYTKNFANKPKLILFIW